MGCARNCQTVPYVGEQINARQINVLTVAVHRWEYFPPERTVQTTANVLQVSARTVSVRALLPDRAVPWLRNASRAPVSIIAAED